MGNNQIIEDCKKLINDLSMHCVDSMQNKAYSMTSKLPFKVMLFVNSMNWRMKECSEAALLLLESRLTHPSLMLIRGAMENAAMIISMAELVSDVVAAKTVEKDVDGELMKILFANNYKKDDPFAMLEDEDCKAKRIGKRIQKADALYPNFQRYYSYLCEFVHPNSDGVVQSYSLIKIDEGYTEIGPRLDSKHSLYKAFLVTLLLSLTIYIEQINAINGSIDSFSHVCEKTLSI